MQFLRFLKAYAKRRPVTIYESHRPLAVIAGMLGTFPGGFITKPDGTTSLQFRNLSLRTFYCVSIFVFCFMVIVPGYPAYVSLTIKTANMRRTDGFAFACFIGSYFSVRLVCFGVSLSKTNSLLRVMNSFKRYDDGFGFFKQISIFDHHFWLLLIGSFLNILGNFLVSHRGFQVIVESNNTALFFVRALTSDSSLAAKYIFLGHSICEVAIIFFMTTVIFFVRGIQARLKHLENEILEYFEVCGAKGISGLEIQLENNWASYSRKLQRQLHMSCNVFITQSQARLKALVDISKELNAFSKEFVLVYISFALFSLIVAIHIIIIRYFKASTNIAGLDDTSKEMISRGIFAMSMATLFTAARVGLIINVGERLQNLGMEFSLNMALIDSKKLNNEESSIINDLRCISNNHKFAIGACGFFVVNRKLAVSMIGSIITFLVVLAQFRSADISPKGPGW